MTKTQLNPYFNNYNHEGTQNLYDSILKGALSQYGVETYYIPKGFENVDAFMGEALGKYGEYEPFVMYVMNPEGYEGGGEFFAKFGLEIRDNVKLATLTSDWSQGDPRILGTKRYENADGDTVEEQVFIPKRPVEGDLVYIPIFGKAFFEITFVEDERPFFPHGQLFLYELNCSKFIHGGEKFDLVPDVDADEKEIRDVKQIDQVDDEIEERDKVIRLIIPDAEKETDEERHNTEDDQYDFAEKEDVIVPGTSPFSTGDEWADGNLLDV